MTAKTLILGKTSYTEGQWMPARVHSTKGWVETDSEGYYYALGALPPVYFDGGFYMGEPYDHDRNGIPIYYAFAEWQDRYFIRLLPEGKGPDAVKALKELLGSIE